MKVKSARKEFIPKKILNLFSAFSDLILWFDAELRLLEVWTKEITNQSIFAALKDKMHPNVLIDSKEINYFYEELAKVILGEQVPEMHFLMRNESSFVLSLKPVMIIKTNKKYICVTGQLISVKNSKEEALRKQINIYTETQKLAKIGSWEINWANSDFWVSEELHKIFHPESYVQINTIANFLSYVHPEDKYIVQNQFHAQN